MAAKKNDIFDGVDDKRRLNNAQRKAIVEETDKLFTRKETAEESQYQINKSKVLKVAQREFKVATTLAKISKLNDEKLKLLEGLRSLGFDETGEFRKGSVYNRDRGCYEEYPKGTELARRLDKLEVPDNKEYQNQINNKLWLAGSVGEARAILNSIK